MEEDDGVGVAGGVLGRDGGCFELFDSAHFYFIFQVNFVRFGGCESEAEHRRRDGGA